MDDRIIWLEGFIVLWDRAEDNNDFNMLGRLTRVLGEFCEKHELEPMSADELIMELIMELKAKES